MQTPAEPQSRRIAWPRNRREQWIAAALLAIILAASGVVAAKVQWSRYLLGKWAWEDRVERFTAEPLDKAQVAKYGVHTNPVKEPPHPAKASFKVMPADGWVKQSGDAVGSTYAGTLALVNMDGMHFGMAVTDASQGAQVTVSSAGGSATIGWVKSAFQGGAPTFPAPSEWSAAEQQAWNDWIAGNEAQPGDTAAFGFLYAATASVGGAEGATQTIYKCFGYYTEGMAGLEEESFWYGDTEWVLPFSISITNCVPYAKTEDRTFTTRLSPRSPADRKAQYILMADGTTVMTATLGGASASGTVTPDMPDPDATDLTIIGGHLAQLHCTIAYANAPQVNTSYAEIRDVSMSGDIPLTLTCNMWNDSADGTDLDDWYASATTPANPWWRYFNDGGTFKLHRIGGGVTGSAGACSSTTNSFGPIRYNICAGRGGYGDDFPLPDALFDVGLRQYTSETETEVIWLGPGLSDWYTVSFTCRALNAGVALRTGTYQIALDPSVYLTAKESWLTSSGELLEAARDEEGLTQSFACDNRSGIIGIPSVESTLDSGSPYWGPAIDYVHADISADIPPGEATRPTLWTAGTNVTIDGSDNTKWTVSGGTGTVTRSLVSRKPLRFAYMAQYDYTGDAPNPDWPLINKANFVGNGDTAAMIAEVPVEDVTNYDNSRMAQLSFETAPLVGGVPTPPPQVDWTQVTLRITHSHWDFIDNRYSPANYGSTHRFGTDSDFPEGLNQITTVSDFTGENVFDTDGVTQLYHLGRFDLAQLRRTNEVHLQNVESVQIIGLPAGYYVLDDWRLIEDPDAHGALDEQGNNIYPHWQPQQGTRPWNWATCKMGWGSTYEGAPHCNLINGTESGDSPLKGDVQVGITGTEFVQYNPEWLAAQEEPPTADPTYARILQRLANVLSMQEQLSGSTINTANVTAATEDADDTLGFLYMWDLQRETSDDGEGMAALHVGTLKGVPYGIPHVKHTVNLFWTTHGRAQGMVLYPDKSICRGSGACSDTEEHPWLLLRKSTTLPGDWQPCGSGAPDVTGRLILPPAKESGYTYGLRSKLDQDEAIGEFVTREYANCSPNAVRRYDPFQCREPGGVKSWLILEDGTGNCYTHFLDHRPYPHPRATDYHPFQTSNHRRPSIGAAVDGALYACATNITTSSMEISRTRKDGFAEWEAPVATLGADLQDGAVLCHQGQVHLIGWKDDKVYFCSSSATDMQREVLDGTNTLLEVCDYAVSGGASIPRTSLAIHDDGSLIACVDGGGSMNLYRCRSYRDGFTLVT